MKKLITVFFLGTMFYQLGWSQSGDEYFEKKDYRNAAIRYEIEAISDANKYLNLGKSYFALKEFELATEAMKKYRNMGTDIDKAYVDNFIDLLERDDDYVEVTNLGSPVNTEITEYMPIVTLDGKRIYFIANGRAGGLGGEDIWYSDKLADGKWNTPVAFNEINTDSHEGLLSISGDGNVAIVFGNYKGTFGGGDLFYSVKTGSGWTMPCNLGGDINSDKWEAQAKLAPDGKTLFFCSDREGGQGFNDIWVTELTTNGWTEPINLGPTINTDDGDYGPFLAADMKTLYFHSYGHEGFGESDIFMSKRLDDSWTNWSKPVNLGKYINTLDEDKYISLPASGIKGYLVRDGQIDGYGAMDLYQFIIPPSMRPEMVFNIHGRVYDAEEKPVGAIIKFIDAKTNVEKARAVSNPEDGEYKVSLPPNRKYNIIIDMKGFLYYTDVLDLTNDSLWMNDATIQEKIADEMENMRKYKKRFDNYNMQLVELMDSNTTAISAAFREFEDLSDDFRVNSRNLDMSIKRAKLAWMSEENKELDLERDFELNRIVIGAKFELKNIFFDFGKASIREESKAELDKLYDIMSRSDIIIELGGHTDNVGSEESNKRLSQDRVNSVRTYLVDEKGLESSRIAAVGYGEERPVASNETEEGRQQNRRVEVQITDIQPREGGDVLTKDDLKEPNEEEIAQFDLLETLQYAAKKGGLPKGSPCSDEVSYLYDDDTDYKVTTTNKAVSVNTIDLDNYIYKTFNAHILTYGYKNTIAPGSLLGAGFTMLNKESLREFHAEYYFKGSDSLKMQLGLGYLWTVQLTDVINLPITLHIGVDWNLVAPQTVWLSSNDSTAANFFNLPIGIRYIYQYSDDITIGPEFMYVLGHNIKSFKNNITGEEFNSKYMRFGVNARWKFVQGGLFYNAGPAVNYFGLRAGFAF